MASREMQPPSQVELAQQLYPDLKAIFDDNSDDAGTDAGSRLSSRAGRPDSQESVFVEVHGGYTESLRQRSATTEIARSRPSTTLTRVSTKSLALSVSLDRRVPMAGVCGPSQEMDPIDVKPYFPSMRPSLNKPSCSDSLLIYRENERAASADDSLRSGSTSTIGVEDVSGVSHPTAAEHRWGANAQALSRSKKISSVVRARSTPPVLPTYIVQLMDGSHLDRAVSEAGETKPAVHLDAVWASAAADAVSMTETIEQQHPGWEKTSDSFNTTHPVPGLVYYASHDEPGTPLDDLIRSGAEVPEHETEHEVMGCSAARPGTADLRADRRVLDDLVGKPRPATSAGTGPSGRGLIEREMLKESESFGLLMLHDSFADSLLPVGVAAQHAPDFHLGASFGSGKHGKGIFSRPSTRESCPVSPSRMSGHLASSGLVGEHKVLTGERPESPSKLGAKVKARPKAGLKTMRRERARRRESSPPSERKSPRKSKFPSALYIDVDRDGDKGTSRPSMNTFDVARSKAVTQEGTGKNEGGDLIAVFPPSPQVRAELSRMGLSEFSSPLIGRGQSEVVLQHLQHLENYGYTHVGARTRSLSGSLALESEGEASYTAVNRARADEVVGSETIKPDNTEEDEWQYLKIDGQALTGKAREVNEEVLQACAEDGQHHGLARQPAMLQVFPGESEERIRVTYVISNSIVLRRPVSQTDAER